MEMLLLVDGKKKSYPSEKEILLLIIFEMLNLEAHLLQYIFKFKKLQISLTRRITLCVDLLLLILFFYLIILFNVCQEGGRGTQ